MLTAEDGYRILLESAPDGVVIADENGTIVLVNAQTERLFAYERDELVGQPIEILLPERFREAYGSHRGSYLSEPKAHEMGAGLELAGRRKDGSEFPVDISLNPLQTDDRVLVLAAVRDVTERVRSEERLRQSEQQFRNAFTFAAIGMALVGPDGRFLEVNDSLCEIVGYSNEDLLSKTFQDITHPDDLEADLEFVRQMLAGDLRTYQMEKRYFHKHGHVVWVLLSVTLVRASDGSPVHFISQIQDITVRKEAQARLAEAETRYRTLVEQLPLATYIRPLDMSQSNMYASPQVEPMLGFPPAEWESNPDLLGAIVHPDDRERVIEAGNRVRATGEPSRLEYRYIARDGRIVWVQDETYVVPDETGKPFCVQGYLLDITERKQAEEEREWLRDELHHAQKLEALGRLAGGVAHDFNNVLTAIKGYGELLLDDLPQGTPARKSAEQVLRAAEQASNLPQQLLAFGRKQVLEPTLLDLDAAVDEAVDLLRRIVRESIDVVTSLESHAPVLADPSRLEQVLMNLVVNARDAMLEGGTLTIATRTATVETEVAAEHEVAPGEYAVIAVSDTGHGMDAETRARAFEPFFTTKAPGLGSGLGLATAYGTVRQSGGFMRVESEVGEGTTFEIYLPCEPHQRANGAGLVEVATAGELPARVLLVEDEDMVRDVARAALERAGFEVTSAALAEEALAAFRAKDRIDVVVTDMVMPGMGGRELADRILHVSPATPVVFMSGYTDEPPVVELNGAAPSFLQKPFSPSTLVAAVEEALVTRTHETPNGSHNGRITCVVADDHPAVLDSVSRFLETRGFQIVARASRGDDALEAIASNQPALALLDIAMQPLDGLEVARRAAEAAVGTQVVLYTGARDRGVLTQAFDAGARGFVLKEAPLPELARALEIVAGGGTYVDGELGAIFAAGSAQSSGGRLTRREREILGLLAEGLTNEKAAASLGISAETVQSHVHNAMAKLDADTRTQAVATALRQSLID